MDGITKTFTHIVTVRVQQFLCSKLKTQENASVAIPKLSGHLHLLGFKAGRMLVIVVRCCSTCLAKGTSQTKEQARRFFFAGIWGLVLLEIKRTMI